MLKPSAARCVNHSSIESATCSGVPTSAPLCVDAALEQLADGEILPQGYVQDGPGAPDGPRAPFRSVDVVPGRGGVQLQQVGRDTQDVREGPQPGGLVGSGGDQLSPACRRFCLGAAEGDVETGQDQDLVRVAAVSGGTILECRISSRS